MVSLRPLELPFLPGTVGVEDPFLLLLLLLLSKWCIASSSFSGAR